ncbi:hypothetical protein NQ317_000583 [Molorchus minor]|uniref:Uncharacterized protein n=1 Tax=Molorchus minor TaxID=1323400 RepID=A0ABQ9IWQ9_9CUCU|nr:hypothetical protein NQ317_000583 [Molorchus minor]
MLPVSGENIFYSFDESFCNTCLKLDGKAAMMGCDSTDCMYDGLPCTFVTAVVIFFVESVQRCVAPAQLLTDSKLSCNRNTQRNGPKGASYLDMNNLRSFKENTDATNLFGGGMDIEGVNNIVFNDDIPEDSDTYLHRVAKRIVLLKDDNSKQCFEKRKSIC